MHGTCDYAEGRCGCLGGCVGEGGQVNGVWGCRAWTDGVGSNCPSARPLLGTTCNLPDGTTCHYTEACVGPSLGPSMQCSGGLWVPYYETGDCDASDTPTTCP